MNSIVSRKENFINRFKLTQHIILMNKNIDLQYLLEFLKQCHLKLHLNESLKLLFLKCLATSQHCDVLEQSKSIFQYPCDATIGSSHLRQCLLITKLFNGTLLFINCIRLIIDKNGKLFTQEMKFVEVAFTGKY